MYTVGLNMRLMSKETCSFNEKDLPRYWRATQRSPQPRSRGGWETRDELSGALKPIIALSPFSIMCSESWQRMRSALHIVLLRSGPRADPDCDVTISCRCQDAQRHDLISINPWYQICYINSRQMRGNLLSSCMR